MKDDNFLKENNARHMWHPMAHPADSLANPPRVITGASGVRIKDLDGNEVIDAVGGLWNVNLGYSCDPIKQAISDQLNALPYYSTFRGTSNDAVIELSYILREFFDPEGLSRANCGPLSGKHRKVISSVQIAPDQPPKTWRTIRKRLK